MATCKDCLHYEVCNISDMMLTNESHTHLMPCDDCPCFKDRGLFVELPPVKIGDTAFFIINGNIFAGIVYFVRWECHEGYGIHSDISARFSQYTTIEASFDDFGKTVFLTRAEAENALEERRAARV